jgi:hypothetical protein
MPTRSVFRCQFCDATPDHGTWRSLQGQVTERMFGEYLDAFPGRWLVWNGGGPLGPRRYACRKHRGDLVAYLRYHYATVAAQVWKMPPYTQRWPDEKRPHMGGSMGIIKFGLRGGLLQDTPPDRPEPKAPEPAEPAKVPAPAAEGPDGIELFPPGELFLPDDLLAPADPAEAADLPDLPAEDMWRDLPPAEDMWPGDGPWPPGFPPEEPPGLDPPPAV